MSYFKEFSIDTNNATGDAFGRVRTSTPETIFDAKQIFDNAPLFWDDSQISGSGTGSSHSAFTASTTLSVSNATAGRRVRQTFQRFNYQPGKSFLVLLTGCLIKTGGGAGITTRCGYYDDNNGLFFEYDAGQISVVRRTSTSGSPVDNKISQSSFNIDKMDGTGSSGITVDFSKTNIFIIDFEWLGVGRVRFGFNINGISYFCHEILNANVLTSVYMSTPNLPLRYEIINSGTGPASTIEHICTSAMSEGGLNPIGIIRSASNNGTHVDANVENTIYAVLGIRLKSTHFSSTVKIIDISLALLTASHAVEWMLFLNPTVAGVFTYADEPQSAVQIARGALANTVTGGIRLAGGHTFSASVSGGAAGVAAKEVDTALRIGSSIAGVADTIVLCVRPIDGATNVDIEGCINWRELS